jgi:mRNA-degrading endonuclease YafQ of YafQ-DinJ toxin-antitoxin module
MARSARRYDLYLPLSDNEGRPFAAELFDGVERRLVAQFGGLTTQQRDFPLRGIWQGERQVYLDLVIVMTVLDFRRQGSARFIAKLKQDLLRAFEQLEILITEQPLRVH